jgi:diguanylate cyclase (GGDEF)-like protein
VLRHEPISPPTPQHWNLVDSYRRLADVFHDVLAEQDLDTLLDRIADTLAELIPHDTLTLYRADEQQRVLTPVLARDEWEGEIMRKQVAWDEGISGWAAANREPVLANRAHLDPRVGTVPGTPKGEPEAMISIPLVSRSAIKGVLNVYRLGADAAFGDDEFELAQRFADAAALALDNAEIRARLEREAQTDALTGLFNHRVFHERLRAALQEASRTQRQVAVLMLDIDDFKRVNDVHGHAIGDELLRLLGAALRDGVRSGDIVCRLGGEEFGVIMEGATRPRARRLARRLVEKVWAVDYLPPGPVTVSIGIALGPEHAMNPRELAVCAEAAMMTAKARGKNDIVLFDDRTLERPEDVPDRREQDVRSVAHLKLLQSVSGKLSRLVAIDELGATIAEELRSLIDYHNCRVFTVEGEDVVPVAFRGDLNAEMVALPLELLRCKVGEGITGRAAAVGQSILVGDAAASPFGRRIPGTQRLEESLVAVPLKFASRVNGVIVVSKLGIDQFDKDDVRLLEVLAGQAAGAFENARLYEAARREAESAQVLLGYARELALADGPGEVARRVVEQAASLLRSPSAALWQREGGATFLLACVGPLLAEDPPDSWLDAGEPFVVAAGDREVVVSPFGYGCLVVGPSEAASGLRAWELRLVAGLADYARLALRSAH